MQNVEAIATREQEVSVENARVDGALMKLSIGLGVVVVGAFAVLAAVLPHYMQ